MVHTGETISILLVAAGITLTREGTALMAGSLGDRVRIQLDKNRSLSGVVAGPATVRIQ
jgi:flagella basal body P-ring formation protein FlgA